MGMAEMKKLEDGNSRSLDNLQMEGSEMFNFVQTEVPPLIDGMFGDLRLDKEEI